MKKEQLSKLASLENPKTLKFLEEFALEEKEKITAAKSNEEIIQSLDLLDAIYYRVPAIIIRVVYHLLYKTEPIKPTVERTNWGTLEGKTFSDVQVKCFELVRHIRYYEIDKSITIAFDFINSTDKVLSSIASKLAEEISEYNHHVLPKIGTASQRKVLEFLEKKLSNDKSNKFNIYFIKIALHHILETSSNATTMTSPDTLTFSHGDIVGSVNIAEIRERAIKIVINILEHVESTEDKNSIFGLIEQACRMPMNSPRDSDLGKIIQDNRVFIVESLRNITFLQEKIIQPLWFCLKLEHLMLWSFIHIELQVDIGKKFLSSLYKDDRYKLFSRFVYDDSSRYIKDNVIEGMARDTKSDIKNYLESIAEKKEEIIFEQLNDIATEAFKVDEWKYLVFKQLLEEMGKSKPEVAYTIGQSSIKERAYLSRPSFLSFLLSGIRQVERFDLWDNIAKNIFKSKDIEILSTLIGSMFLSANAEKSHIRKKEDFNLIFDLIHRKNQFKFYGKSTNTLRHFTMNVLKVLFSISPKKTEELVILEIKNNPEYLNGYLQTISMASEEGGFNLNKWTKKGKNFLRKELLKLNDVDWHIQSILPTFCNPEEILNFFINRIKYREKLFGEGRYFDSPGRFYDPVPYHINHELIEFTKKDSKIAEKIAKRISSKYNSHSLEISQFIKNFGISLEEIDNALYKKEKNKETALKKTIRAIYGMESNDIDFIVGLAARTSNQRIFADLYAKIASTGVVSGEFGIADAYRGKIEALEKYTDNENKNIRDFATFSIERLKYSEEQARRDAEEEKEIRRVDFESNN